MSAVLRLAVPVTSIAFAPLLPILAPVSLAAIHTIGFVLVATVTEIAPVLALVGIARKTTNLFCPPVTSMKLTHVTPFPDTVGVMDVVRMLTMTKSNSLGLTVHEAKLTGVVLFLAVMDCAIATATN